MSNGQAVNQQFITKLSQDLLAFLRHRPGVALESLTHSTPEMSFDLGKVRQNKVIHNRGGDRIFVMNVTGVAYIRFNSTTGSKYKLRVGSICTPFQKLYLENEAQAGKSVSIIIGYGAFVDFASAYLTTKLLKANDSEVNPASEEKQDTMLGQLDRKTSALASEGKQDSMLGQLDIKLTQLRDALMDSATPKDLKDLYDELYSMRGAATPKSLKQVWDVLTTISGLDFATDTGLAVIAGKDFATQATLALMKAKTDNLDVALSTKAKEDGGNLLTIKNSVAKLDLFLSELRDAITGVVGAKTLLDVVNAFEELPEKTEIQATTFNQQTAVNVGTSATLILAQNANRKGFYIRHNGDDIIYLGNSSVATGNGLPFFPGNIFTEEHLPVTAAIYGVVVAATEEVRRVEET